MRYGSREHDTDGATLYDDTSRCYLEAGCLEPGGVTIFFAGLERGSVGKFHCCLVEPMVELSTIQDHKLTTRRQHPPHLG